MVGVDLSFFVFFFYYALVHVLKFHNLTFVFQIHSFQSILQIMPVSTAEEAKVTSIFLTLFFQNTSNPFQNSHPSSPIFSRYCCFYSTFKENRRVYQLEDCLS